MTHLGKNRDFSALHIEMSIPRGEIGSVETDEKKLRREEKKRTE